MKNEKQKEKIIIDCLKKINPKLIKIVDNKKYNLTADIYLDSFDVMSLIIEIERKTKKKINTKNINVKNFKNIETIKKII